MSAWGGAGTNPTLATNWAFDNTPGELAAATSSYQEFAIEGISVSASANNVAVFIWTDDVTMSVGDFLYIADVNLVQGATAVPIMRRSYEEDLMSAQRMFYRIDCPNGGEVIGVGHNNNTANSKIHLPFPVSMRAAPSLSFRQNTQFTLVDGSNSSSNGNITILTNSAHKTGFLLNKAPGSGMTNDAASVLQANTAGTWLAASARL